MTFKIKLHSSRSSVFLVLIFLGLRVIQGYIVSDDELRDLIKTDEPCFIEEASKWSASNLVSSTKHFSCTGTFLLGGQNILGSTAFASGKYGTSNQFFQRQYDGLPGHKSIRYTFTFWALDSWESGDTFEFYFDGSKVNGWQMTHSSFQSNLCAGSDKDLRDLKIYGRKRHSSNSLTFKIVSKLDQPSDNESFGVRDIHFLFADNSDSEQSCARSPLSSIPSSNKCSCSATQYYDSSDSDCKSCSSSCQSCFRSGNDRCYECKPGKYFDGNDCDNSCHSSCSVCSGPDDSDCDQCVTGMVFGGKCDDPIKCISPLVPDTCNKVCNWPCGYNGALYWDGTCGSPCNLPLQAASTNTNSPFGTVTECSYSCLDSEFLYWNSTCETFCNAPLKIETIKGKKLCTYPCTGGKHLYWNGSCITGCAAPLEDVTEGGQKFCKFPCASTTDFLYTNTSCLSTCSPPLITRNEPGGKFCIYPCTGTDWLYWNNTCKSSCPAPLQQRVENTNQFCDYPCTSSQYLYWNGTCKSQCASPLIPVTISGKRYCTYPCLDTEFLEPDGNCATSCGGPARIEGGKQFCDPGCASNEHLYWYGACSTSCPYPLKITDIAGVSHCEHICANNQYLYWDQTCSSTCKSPLTPNTQNGKLFCLFPCPSGQALNWNGACLPTSSCTGGLVAVPKGTETLCEFTCTSNEYPKLDGSCVTECSLPYTLKYYVNRFFCDYYCQSGYLDFLTMTCVSSCPEGFYEDTLTRSCIACQVSLCKYCSVHAGLKCDVCESETILDNNGKCDDCQEMQIGYVKSIQNGHQYTLKLLPGSCDLDESVVQNRLQGTQEAKNNFPPFRFQVHKQGSNLYTVDLIIDGTTLTVLTLDVVLDHLKGSMSVPRQIEVTPTIKMLQELAPSAQTVLVTASAGSAVGIISMGASAALWNMINFQQFVGYFIYINVEYPPQTELFLSIFQFASFDFLPNPLASLTEMVSEGVSSLKDTDEEKYQPPLKFVKYDGTSFFIDNGGSMLSTGLGLILLLFASKVLRRVRLLRIDKLAKKVFDFLKWNAILRGFLESGIPLALSVFLQIRRVSYTSFYTACSVLMASVGFSYFFLMLQFALEILSKNNDVELNKKGSKDLYGTLYEGISLKKKQKGKYYHLLILIRGVLLMFMIAFFEISPVFQIIPLIFFNIGLIVYLSKLASFEDRHMNTVNKIKESLILMGEFGILMLNFNAKYPEYYSDVGWMIVGCLGGALAVELIYVLVLQIMGIKDLYHNVKKAFKLLFKKETKKRKRVNRPLRIEDL